MQISIKKYIEVKEVFRKTDDEFEFEAYILILPVLEEREESYIVLFQNAPFLIRKDKYVIRDVDAPPMTRGFEGFRGFGF